MSRFPVNLLRAPDWYARYTVIEISWEMNTEVGQISLSGPSVSRYFRSMRNFMERQKPTYSPTTPAYWFTAYEVARVWARNQAGSDLRQVEVRGWWRTWQRERQRDRVGKLPARFGRVCQKNPYCRKYFSRQTADFVQHTRKGTRSFLLEIVLGWKNEIDVTRYTS